MMALAKSLLEQGKNLAAGEVLEQAIAIQPKPAYHHAHAMTALNAGQLDAAEFSAFEAAGRPEAPTGSNPMK